MCRGEKRDETAKRCSGKIREFSLNTTGAHKSSAKQITWSAWALRVRLFKGSNNVPSFVRVLTADLKSVFAGFQNSLKTKSCENKLQANFDGESKFSVGEKLLLIFQPFSACSYFQLMRPKCVADVNLRRIRFFGHIQVIGSFPADFGDLTRIFVFAFRVKRFVIIKWKIWKIFSFSVFIKILPWKLVAGIGLRADDKICYEF